MRLWSISPKYLDRVGLVSLWRESLLAQKVLVNKAKGYRNHPQLERFKHHRFPIEAIGFYLYDIYKEGRKRGYNFTKKKIIRISKKVKPIKITRGQIDFEFWHLLTKLKKRNRKNYEGLFKTRSIKLHPLFVRTKGKIEELERQGKYG